MKLAYKATTVLVACLLYCQVALATDFVVPTQKILTSEAPVIFGEILTFTLTPIATPPKYLEATSMKWKVLDTAGAEKTIVEQANGCFCGTGVQPATLNAMCAVTYLYVVRDGDKITEIATRTVFLLSRVRIGPLPNPNPIPPPDPKPIPPQPIPIPVPVPDPVVIPDGRYKLGKSIYDLTMKNVPATNRVKGAQALARSFRGIASAIAAGGLKDQTEILKQAQASNRAALTAAGISPAEWNNAFVGLQELLFTLYSNQQIGSAADFQQAFLEISSGLEAIR